MSTEAPWPALRRFTEARIGLGRAGSALPIKEVLSFAMAHAQARDAVITPIDWAPIERDLAGLGQKTVRVDSAAPDRDTYLRRPDLGRRLSAKSRERLAAAARPTPDLLIMAADGLSSTGVAANAVAVIAALLPLARKSGWMLGPVVLASQGRVALGDDAGEIFGARAMLVLIGERPGLSSPDSLGAYLTYAPRVGRKDGERNCVSNIRRGGLGAGEAAFKIHWLLREAFRRSLTGVLLKDESSYLLEGTATRAELSQPRPSENTKG
jgi:ethanolamine ammonia-lyase small subunit